MTAGAGDYLTQLLTVDRRLPSRGYRAVGPDLLDAVVVTTGRHAYRRPDGIGVVPLALLGP